MRRFRLLDVMILVAATAGGCAGVNALLANRDPDEIFSWNFLSDVAGAIFESTDFGMRWMLPLMLCGEVLSLCAPIAAAWGVALIAIRWIGPRPRWRRLARQPGMMACCASTLSIFFLGWHAMIYALGHRYQMIVDSAAGPVGTTLIIWQMLNGLAVVAAWMTLFLGGRWRAEPSWIDRLGRAIGVYWVMNSLSVVHLLFVI